MNEGLADSLTVSCSPVRAEVIVSPRRTRHELWQALDGRLFEKQFAVLWGDTAC